METINERFRKLREETGLSQEEFANRANRTRSEIKNVEYGKTNPKDEVIRSICKTYNVNENWLRDGTGDMHKPVERDAELEVFLSEVMNSESEDFRRRLITVLSKLDHNEWALLEKMAVRLAADSKKED